MPMTYCGSPRRTDLAVITDEELGQTLEVINHWPRNV
ncbi:putative transposase [Streptococcus mutans M2A]|jgi:hypothetical protein|uniref:Transposase n=2 Tax=Streptococcus mutans TaxID=1309 RepID=Q8DSH2_STRMU|nr:putative transposase fragment [Streptococcus mutans UA159]EMB60835.1 putative transposase [Streptococcus mutans 8ID3]EMB63937.1 putative transposase [Streptococcus mutans 4SM1]EMB76668.1 putative transposase [Streptococcus mutans 11VS1]EMB76984.1 putative transposase [Streptococcus mutans 2VS1]EMB79206.1 putative transposase [Streptococcus mutans NFSM2]EMB91643.1 putative transposase [Streptococcus mutans A19]EMB91897.1 putative transposase [Streptococcus mutans U138]EMB95618.1 putative 